MFKPGKSAGRAAPSPPAFAAIKMDDEQKSKIRERPHAADDPFVTIASGLLLYFRASISPTSLTPMADITTTELRQRLQAGETPHLLDVRETWEHEEGRIPTAQNIPLGTLPDKLDDLEAWKDQEVIVHCKGGGRSASAKAFLTQQGFTNVRNLVGGYQAYAADGQ